MGKKRTSATGNGTAGTGDAVKATTMLCYWCWLCRGAVTCNELPLVGMEDGSVDRGSAFVFPLTPPRTHIPHFDGAVFTCCEHPPAVLLKSEGCIKAQHPETHFRA